MLAVLESLNKKYRFQHLRNHQPFCVGFFSTKAIAELRGRTKIQQRLIVLNFKRFIQKLL